MGFDPRIAPVTDPNPITPRVEVGKLDTSDLPEYAKTAEEWWAITDRIWPAILDIFDRVGLGGKTSSVGDENGPIADFQKYAEQLKAARDPKLANWLDMAWQRAPDAYFIHTWPQWSRFCDLCSEQHVLFPEEE